MQDLLSIELRQLRFFAFHGLFPEERKTGNDFEVNLIVDYYPPDHLVTEIVDTINYAELYEIVKDEMARPTDLLETIVMKIAERIQEEFPQAARAEISIYKLNPPIAKFPGTVGTRLVKLFQKN